MDHDNAGGVVSGGCNGCGHNSCDFDLILPLTFEERYILCIIIMIAQLHVPIYVFTIVFAIAHSWNAGGQYQHAQSDDFGLTMHNSSSQQAL